jgi:STAS domain-containing protein
VICDVRGITLADLGTVDALARLQLTARRRGGNVQLKNAAPCLRNLLALAGLADVVRCSTESVDPKGQPEHREEPGRVEEERDPADLPA